MKSYNENPPKLNYRSEAVLKQARENTAYYTLRLLLRWIRNFCLVVIAIVALIGIKLVSTSNTFLDGISGIKASSNGYYQKDDLLKEMRNVNVTESLRVILDKLPGVFTRKDLAVIALAEKTNLENEFDRSAEADLKKIQAEYNKYRDDTMSALKENDLALYNNLNFLIDDETQERWKERTRKSSIWNNINAFKDKLDERHNAWRQLEWDKKWEKEKHIDPATQAIERQLDILDNVGKLLRLFFSFLIVALGTLIPVLIVIALYQASIVVIDIADCQVEIYVLKSKL